MDAPGAETFCDVQNITRSNTMEQPELLDSVVPKDKTEFIYQGDSEISLFLKVNKMWGSRLVPRRFQWCRSRGEYL